MTANYLEGLSHLKANHNDYPIAPSINILEAFNNQHPQNDYWITFNCPEFTSLCPVTNQPDFGEIKIKYRPNLKCVESKALKLYLFSFRNHNSFHEAVTNTILNDLVALLQPKEMIVYGNFRPRGGISLDIEARYLEAK
ncbi:MAG: preQ(1) synthase [Lentisphaeria bacterium]